ncbi:capsule biosynthesis GfcC D2 domain-containing protein [Dryocola sp. BD613]|uniref:capsule biosynthesis GfcC D2 domain-containing protein n=1 Tax=Dryocola sp. BD613 TaxID=3133272 RepID=UPI003F5090E5
MKRKAPVTLGGNKRWMAHCLSTLRSEKYIVLRRAGERGATRRVSWLVGCLLTLTSSLAISAGNVTLYPGKHQQPEQITGVERLADLVTQPSLSHAWWPGAVISERQASAVARQQHQKLLATLSSLAAREEGDDAAAINSLRRQLQAIHVTGRQFVDLDPDWVRLHPRSNVTLLGDYSLWAGPQPATITLMGLVSSPGVKPFVAGRSADEYLAEVNTLSGADRSYAWVVYPDGKTEKAPIAYWNKRHVELLPGSILFVGFSERLFDSDFNELNQQILTSLTHRIPD